MPSPVAVVVATRDRWPVLHRTLGALDALGDRPAVVVVDNGSRDGTPACVRSRFPRVEVVELGANRGPAARNVGVARAPAPYVAFADDDSWWAPGALRHAAAVLDAHPRLALVAARILVGLEARLDPTCAAMQDSPLAGRPGLPGRPVLGFVACGAVVRRSAFLAVGGFDERFGVGGEEGPLAVDLAVAGWDAAYVPQVVAHHHPADGGVRPGRRVRALRNELWATWLRRPLPTAARRSASLLGAASPRDAACALVAAAGGLGWVARERRAVPAEVEAALRALDRAGRA